MGEPLELKKTLNLPKTDFPMKASLPQRPETMPGLVTRVVAAQGEKCERCWHYSTHVGENPRYPTVCERRSQALAEVEGAEPSKR
jgi:isoleucyl-tRNA synthetase